jgi:hypothetical protein
LAVAFAIEIVAPSHAANVAAFEATVAAATVAPQTPVDALYSSKVAESPALLTVTLTRVVSAWVLVPVMDIVIDPVT